MQKRLLQLHYEESKVCFSYSWNQYHVENFLQLHLKQKEGGKTVKNQMYNQNNGLIA